MKDDDLPTSQFEKALRESAELYSRLFENHHAAVLAENHVRLPAETLTESLRFILKSGQKRNSITDNLLLLSQVRQKDIPVGPLDMGVIVAEARLRVSHLINDQPEICVPAEWPRALEYQPWVEAVWANYLSNAHKYAGQPRALK